MANTLKFGRGTWATKTGSSMAYNDQNGNYKPLPFNVERDSIATRVNKQGLIEVVGKDKLRIDYTDSAKGVALLENSSTNLFTYSEDFSQDWISGGGGAFTITPNAVVSPDGTQNASKLIASGLGYQLRQNKAIINTQMSNSFYMRTNQGTRQMSIRINDNEISQTFTVTSEWKRYTVSGLVGGTLFGSGRCSLNNVDILDENNHVYIWGAQLEQGSYPTSYIPTSGSTVQRQADVVSGSGNSEVFNNVEGTIFINANFVNNSDVQVLCSVHDFASNKRLEIWANNNLINGFIGGSSSITVGSSNLINGSHKIALNYKSGNSSFYIDGFLIGSSSSTFTIAELTKMTLGYYSTTQYQSESATKEVGYYDTILTDVELEYLTSYRSLNELVTELNLNTL